MGNLKRAQTIIWTNCNFSHFTPLFETQAPRCLTFVTILSCFDPYQCLYPLFHGANHRPILLEVTIAGKVLPCDLHLHYTNFLT